MFYQITHTATQCTGYIKANYVETMSTYEAAYKPAALPGVASQQRKGTVSKRQRPESQTHDEDSSGGARYSIALLTV